MTAASARRNSVDDWAIRVHPSFTDADASGHLRLPTFLMSAHDKNQENEVKSTSFRRAIVPGIAALVARACRVRRRQRRGAGDGEGGGGASGSVTIDGSSTVYPMTQAASELLAEENPTSRPRSARPAPAVASRVLRRRDRHLRRLASDRGRGRDRRLRGERRRVHRAPGRHRRAHRRRAPRPRRRLPDHRPAHRALGPRLQDHQLEPTSTRASPTRRSRCSVRAPTPAPTTTWPPT